VGLPNKSSGWVSEPIILLG